MRFAKPPRLHVYSFWFSMPVITFTLMYIMYNDRVWKEGMIWLVTWPIIYSIGYLSWYAHLQYDSFLRRRFPSLQETGKRVLYKLAVNLLVMTPSVLLIFYVFERFHILGYRLQYGDLKYGYLVGLSVNVIFEALWEVTYIIDRYKETMTEKEQVEEMQLQQEFDKLKEKVNPHFLFNCFNTLSSLITEDKNKAEAFLNGLSKVYRYLLRNNEDGMSSVENEMKFILSYFQLLKTRYGDAINLRTEIDKQHLGFFLPSLSLQLLVENAVKHNALSRTQPLSIEIVSAEGNKLEVRNNLQALVIKASGNKVGLQNIRAKYELLNQPGFQVMMDENNFIVALPLMSNYSIENKKDQPILNNEII
jgi:two-component system LytT family sensor kinase